MGEKRDKFEDIVKKIMLPPFKDKDAIHRGLNAGGLQIAENQTHIIVFARINHVKLCS